MPRRDWSSKLERATFRCGACRNTFQAEPDLVDDDAANPSHPFRYFARCTACGEENVPQASWERALMVAHQAATGPTTSEGKAASAANLAGHPTPAESRLTRFNAMKHGLEARVATYFPAKPDKYAHCQRCDVDRAWCAAQPACVKQIELFMQHHVAVETRDPKALGKLHADLLASVTAMLQQAIQAVLGDGVVIKTPRVELAKDGYPVAMTYEDQDGIKHQIFDYAANPLFKPVTDLITRLGLSMSDLGLTYKASEEEDPAGVGQLRSNGGTKPEGLEDFSKRMLVSMENARELVAKAQSRMRKDPVLIEHEAQSQEQGG